MKRDLILLATLAVVCVVLMFVGVSGFWLNLIITALIFASFATAWNVAGGFTGLFSLGHGAFFAAGAYVPAMLGKYWGVPTLVGIVAGAAVACVLSIVVGLISLRLRGHYFALATIGLGAIVSIVLANGGQITGADEGMSLPFTPDPWQLVFVDRTSYLLLALGLYVFTALIALCILRSKLGLRMRAIREDEVTARSMGISAYRTKLAAFTISGSLSALAGSMFALYTLYITPANTASIDLSLQPALMAIIGGMFGVLGPMIGAFLITFLEQQVIIFIGADIPGLSSLVYGVLLIVTIMLIPTGIAGMFSRLTTKRLWREASLRMKGKASDKQLRGPDL